MLLFRFLGNGFRLALCNVGWLVTQKFVIVYAPWSMDAARYRGTRSTWVTAFPRTNCRTTTAAALRATATATLSLRVCLCFSSPPLSQDDDGGYLPQCVLPQAARHRASFVSPVKTRSVKTHFTRPPSQNRLDGRPRNGLSKWETHIICARSLLGEIEDDTGGTVSRPITSPSTGRPRR